MPSGGCVQADAAAKASVLAEDDGTVDQYAAEGGRIRDTKLTLQHVAVGCADKPDKVAVAGIAHIEMRIFLDQDLHPGADETAIVCTSPDDERAAKPALRHLYKVRHRQQYRPHPAAIRACAVPCMVRAQVSIPPQSVAGGHVGDANVDKTTGVCLAGCAAHKSPRGAHSHEGWFPCRASARPPRGAACVVAQTVRRVARRSCSCSFEAVMCIIVQAI